jgi:hypothetical protein
VIGMAFRVLVKTLVPLQDAVTGAPEPLGSIYVVMDKKDPRPPGQRIGRPRYEFTLKANPGPMDGLGFEDLYEADEVMRQVTSIWDEDHQRPRYTHFQIDGPKTFPNSRGNIMGPRDFGP